LAYNNETVVSLVKMTEKAKSLLDRKGKKGNPAPEGERKPGAEGKGKPAASAVQAMKGLSFDMLTRSVGTKLFLLIFCGILICVLSVGLFSYSTAKSIVKSKVSESSAQTIAQAADKLDLLFSSFDSLTLQYIVDTKMQTVYSDLELETDDYKKFEAVKEIEKKLQDMVNGNKLLYGAAMIPVGSALSGVTSAGSSSIDIEQAKASDWMKRSVEADGRLIWLPTEPNGMNGKGNAPTFGVSRLIKNGGSSNPVFVLLIEVKVDVLEEQLGKLSLGDGSKISIVDPEGRIVYDADPANLGTKSKIVLQAPKDADLVETENYKLDGKQMIGVHKQFKSNTWQLLGTMPVASLVSDAKKIQQLTFIAAFVAALIAAGIGLLVIRMIAVPIGRLRNLMNEGEKGNLAIRSAIKQKDEIGQLAQSFNQMMTQITALVDQTNRSALEVLETAGELSEASKKTAVSAKEIAVATEEIANGATSLAVESERGSELTDNMGQQMKDVMEANAQMSVAASDVEKASRQGTQYMSVLIEKTGLTEEMTRSMVDKVDKLKDSTRSIRKILDVLNNLTKQTNILSLNATIEAARAGAAGKGFMVVADEIRKLADQSRQSIDVVAQITETIQREIDDTVGVLSEAYPIFKEQIESVKEANEIFVTVQAQMGTFVSHLDTVTSSVDELSKTQNVLSEAMSNVSAVAEESSATSEEVASLSNEQLGISDGLVRLSDKLEAVSNGLKETLSRFRTE